MHIVASSGIIAAIRFDQHRIPDPNRQPVPPLPSLLRPLRPAALCVLLAALALLLRPGAAAGYSFRFETVQGLGVQFPTSLAFGPDNRLYVAQLNGLILAITLERSSDGVYTAVATEQIALVQALPNHSDTGLVESDFATRQITGLTTAGTPQQPVLYVSSSDPRIGGAGKGGDIGLDTNSSIISRLEWTGAAWDKVDLVRGLPRSEENHAVNGLQYDAATHQLYFAVGGVTNAGAPSKSFGYLCEFAISAAILRLDLAAIEALPRKGVAPHQYLYDMPTLDDPTRPNLPDGSDPGDPFGGNDGLNQAKLDPAGPISMYSPGYRNAYDLLLTQARRLYTWDNGPNKTWGGLPENEGAPDVTNNYLPDEPGSSDATPTSDGTVINNQDGLHLIAQVDTDPPGAYYGGHPCPIRANPAGAGWYTREGADGVFRTVADGNPVSGLPVDWPPYPTAFANPVEADFQNPGEEDGTLLFLGVSTNGLAEYTASNFGGELQGDLLAASLNGKIYRVDLNSEGSVDEPGSVADSASAEVFASGIGSQPLDIVARGDGQTFPGSVWIALFGSGAIVVLEPDDFINCTGIDSVALDDDNDGYSNADEIDAGSNPCSAASRPPDRDGDALSDVNDPDDDDDGVDDGSDPFPLDADNGLSTFLPLEYELLNGDPGFGFFGLGFTGLMTDGQTDYSELIADEDNSDSELIAGGAVGLFTINGVSSGTAAGTDNTQRNAFQFGLNVMATTPAFTVRARMIGPFFNPAPNGDATAGLFAGSGTQDDFVAVQAAFQSGAAGIEVHIETGGVSSSVFYPVPLVADATDLFLYITINPAAGSLQPRYAVDDGPIADAGPPLFASGALLGALQSAPALALGVLASSTADSPGFNATWDAIEIVSDFTGCDGSWRYIPASMGAFTTRHESDFARCRDKLYLIGGRGSKPMDVYDPRSGDWSTAAPPPLNFHHFQGVDLGGELWVGGAFIGGYPNEQPVPQIYIYNPDTDSWRTGPSISRPRGAGGAFALDGEYYLIGGATQGHTGGHVAWFDKYNPATDTWAQLPDAPRARDHIRAGLIGRTLWLAAGRRSNAQGPGGLNAFMVPEVDGYDFDAGVWETLPTAQNIPTVRAGPGVAVLDGELIVAGGEGDAQNAAHNEVEALHGISKTWRSLPPMLEGRHGMGIQAFDGRLHVCAGTITKGGGVDSPTHEVFDPGCAFAPQLKVEPASLEFVSPAGQLSPPASLTFSNTGPDPLTLGSVQSIHPEFSILSTMPTRLDPGESVSVTLRYTPSAENPEPVQTQLVVLSNAANAPIFRVPLAGEPEAAAPRVEILSPVPPASYARGVPVRLLGTATGSDGESLGASAWWTSSLSGSLGRGLAIVAQDLPPGDHDITLHASEASGTTGSHSIPLSIQGTVLAVNCGGPAYTAADGVTYSPDTGFSGGNAYGKAGPIASTDDPVLYETERYGNFTYSIPVENGTYVLHLQFAEIYYNKASKRIFSIAAEGVPVVENLDIWAVHNANRTATDFFVRVEVTDGTLDLNAIPGGVDNPKLSAFRLSHLRMLPPPAIIPENGHGMLTFTITDGAVVRYTLDESLPKEDTGMVYSEPIALLQPATVTAASFSQLALPSLPTVVDIDTVPPVAAVNCGGPAFVAADGVSYAADSAFAGGKTFDSPDLIDGTEDDPLFQTERFGTFSYAFALPDGRYVVDLMFAEVYFTTSGARVFGVQIEEIDRLINFDILAEAGAARTALVVPLTVDLEDGLLNIEFLPGSANNPKLSALRIRPMPRAARPVIAPQPVAAPGPIAVSLSHPDPSVELFYTADGSSPLDTGALPYGAPFEILPPAVVNAVALHPEQRPSAVATATYPGWHAPSVVVQSPAGGAVHPEHVPLAAAGLAWDAANTDLSDRIAWAINPGSGVPAPSSGATTSLTLPADNYTLEASVLDDSGEAGAASVAFVLQDGYDFWAARIAWNGRDATRLGDADLDGVWNDYERASNMNPLVPDAHLRPFATSLSADGQDYLELTYRRNLAASDVSLILQTAFDLGAAAWQDRTPQPDEITLVSDDGSTRVIRIRIPVDGQLAAWARIRLEDSPGGDPPVQ